MVHGVVLHSSWLSATNHDAHRPDLPRQPCPLLASDASCHRPHARHRLELLLIELLVVWYSDFIFSHRWLQIQSPPWIEQLQPPIMRQSHPAVARGSPPLKHATSLPPSVSPCAPPAAEERPDLAMPLV